MPWLLATVLVTAVVPPQPASAQQPGTTVLTHGFQLNGVLGDAWLDTANRLYDKAQQPCHPAPTILRYDPSTGHWLWSGGGVPNEEFIVVFDWAEQSNFGDLGGDEAGHVGTAGAAAESFTASHADSETRWAGNGPSERFLASNTPRCSAELARGSCNRRRRGRASPRAAGLALSTGSSALVPCARGGGKLRFRSDWTDSESGWARPTLPEAEAIVLRIIREPKVYLVGRQAVDAAEIDRFLSDHQASWSTDTEVGAEQLCEVAGRVCYMSFGKGRKSNREYLQNIIGMAHGSVLEHAVWNFLLVGVSRSFTHELIRHRAGWGYSQLSQRYVDESDCNFVEPDVIAADPELHTVWLESVKQSHEAYVKLVAGLERTFASEPSATLRRKLARQAARSVLPNATETRIFVTANARALRHFFELRGNEHAETEIRQVALQMLRTMQKEAPTLFGDYEIRMHTDGLGVAVTPNRKV